MEEKEKTHIGTKREIVLANVQDKHKQKMGVQTWF